VYVIYIIYQYQGGKGKIMARPKRLKLKDEEGADVRNVKSAIDDETYRHELMRDFKLPTGEIMLGRIRYFSAGMVIGSKQFLKEAYAKYGDYSAEIN
jgi:hypothetical protein